MSIQALREKRAARARTLNELVNKPDWSGERDQPIYDQGMRELDELDAQIQRISALNERIAEEALSHQVADRAERALRDNASEGAALYAKWLRGGDRALSAEEWASIRNTMSTTTNSEGGFTVATDVATGVLDALKAYGGMRSVATVLRTTAGNPMQFPTSDGTAEVGEILAENATATDLDASFGTKALPVYKYSSKVVAVPIELLQDSNVDIEAFIRARLVTRLGRITNTHFTSGTGTGQPQGINATGGAPVGVTAANGTSQVTAVTYDSLVDTQHSVDPAYREAGATSWMMHDTTVRQLRKIKDGSGRPVFVPGYESAAPGGAPDRLLDRPIIVNQDMPVMAASARSILFGDFRYYAIRDVMDVTMMRFADSAYAKKGQVGFLAFMRSGGNLLDVGGAVKAFVNAAS
jgi:HK97 family phage major capsid protein